MIQPASIGGRSGARLTTVLECEIDMEGRFTLWHSGDSHRPSRPSAGAATSCGPAARSPVAHERFGPWWERPASPKARYGLGARWKLTPRPPPSTGRSHTSGPWREGPSSAASEALHHNTRRPLSLPERRAASSRLDSPYNPSGPTQRAFHSLLYYVESDVWFRHPSRHLGRDGTIHSQPGIRPSR